MNLTSVFGMVLPWYVKYIAAGVVAVALYTTGYIKGEASVEQKSAIQELKIIYKQQQVTNKVIAKHKKIEDKLRGDQDVVKQEGQSYAIKFPADGNVYNEYFVSLFNRSIDVSIPTLSSGDGTTATTVSTSEVLETSVNNNQAGVLWKERALRCEDWAKEQEEAGVK